MFGSANIGTASSRFFLFLLLSFCHADVKLCFLFRFVSSSRKSRAEKKRRDDERKVKSIGIDIEGKVKMKEG